MPTREDRLNNIRYHLWKVKYCSYYTELYKKYNMFLPIIHSIDKEHAQIYQRTLERMLANI
jgi:hypothetical protein